jgi:peroxiredoxin Q/BCP
MKKVMNEVITAVLAAVFFCPSALALDPALSTDNKGSAIEPQPTSLSVGMRAPEFNRTASNGQTISLKQFRGKQPVILYFYPKDGSPGCTKEACAFRDFFNGMKGAPAAIIGVSGDSDDSHKEFAKTHSLPFNLIADTDNSLLQMYHVPFFKGSLHTRVTFVIDKAGKITNIIQYTNDPEVHIREATTALKNASKT